MRRDRLEGRTLGDFVVRERIGEGAFGAVHRAEQPLLAREAVVKVLHGTQGAEGTSRFLGEARLASQLDHPYAAHIYAFGAEPDGVLWLAMELVRGTSLDAILATQGPLLLERFVPLLERIAEVVHAAHERGIVHCDLKPANVMIVSRAGRLYPKLLDFGVAEAAGRTPGRRRGSPPYMAPEQWIGEGVSPRTDLYALGVLSYEALTGRLPFDGSSLMAIARAHAGGAPAPLGAPFPPGLDEALRRAFARAPEDRYADALQLAQAVGAAAGAGTEGAPLPQLDPALRERLLAGAPRPIAEAVAGLEAARGAHQGRDAVRLVVRAAARLVGVCALACRARVAGAPADPGALVDAVRTLRRRAPGDEEWIHSARELCRPFAARRDAFPLPELVSLFFGPRGEEPGDGGQALDALLAAQAAPEPVSDEEQARERLAAALPPLDRALRALSFLDDYALVVPRGESCERWMGTRRTSPAIVRARGRPLPDGHPVLLDRDGSPVVSLYPLAFVAAPAPGAPEELFLIEGKGARGTRFVALPAGFERQEGDDGIWRALAVAGTDELPGDGERGATDAERPYRGLAPFTAADAGLFVGREREVDATVNRLRMVPLVAVVGPSGAGKSSFVHAGVVPALPPSWRAKIIRPGSAPLASLAASSPRDAEVVVVDQFEELFTLCPDAEQRDRFAETLAAIVRDGRSRLILTLRDDFLMRAKALAPLGELIAQGIMLLGTPAAEDLRRIVTEPARRAGYEFDDPALPGEMVEAVADRPGALPLLSFGAATLWERRDQAFRHLTRRAYDAIGGVAGALARHADATLEELSTDEQRLVREAFRQLVTAEGTRVPLGRPELEATLGGGRAGAVVERLVAARLLVVSRGGGGDRIEIAHEALLTAWPRLAEWRREDAEGTRFRDHLRVVARQWEERGRPAGMLWRGDALAEYRRWRARHPGSLTPIEEAFVAASLADAARGRQRRRLAIGVAFAALAAGSTALYVANRRSERHAAEAQRRLLELHVEGGRQALLDGDPERAAAYLSEAYARGADGTALRFLLAQASRALAAEPTTLEHGTTVWWAAFSTDGARIVTAGDDGVARVWGTNDGRLLATLRGHGGPVLDAEVSPDGTRVATASLDGTARVWDAAGGLPIATVGHGGPVFTARFSPDGALVATASVDGTARVFDSAGGREVAVLAGHGARVRRAEWSPDGARVATAGVDGTARIWDAATGRELVALRGHTQAVNHVVWSPDGARVATASADLTVRVWDARDGRLLATATTHTEIVLDLSFSPDGARILVASLDGRASVWEPEPGRLVAMLEGHVGAVTSARWSADGARILTTGYDRTARIWDAGSGGLLATLYGHSNQIFVGTFDPDGRRVVTASGDGTARIWPARTTAFVTSVWTADGPVRSVALTPDAATLLLGGQEGGARLVSASDGRVRATLPGRSPLAPAGLSPDGARAAIPDGDRVRLWDVAGARPIRDLVAEGETTAARFSPDGRLVAAVSADRHVHVWDAASGAPRARLPAHEAEVHAVSLGATRVAVAGADGEVPIWDLERSAVATTLRHRGDVFDVDFCRADGLRVVTAGTDTARIWDAVAGRVIVSLDGHDNEIYAAAFSPDCRLVATAGHDGSVKIWDAADGRALASFTLSRQAASSVAFNSDGDRLAVGVWEGVAYVFDVGLDARTPDEVAAWARCRVPYSVSDGKLAPRTPVCSRSDRGRHAE